MAEKRASALRSSVAIAVAAGALVMVAGVAHGQPSKTEQTKQPVTSSYREVDGTLTGTKTTTWVCDGPGTGLITDIEAELRSSFLGRGTLSFNEAWVSGGTWQIVTNRGELFGPSFTYGYPFFGEMNGVDRTQPNTVTITGPDRDGTPGPDWELDGRVYRAVFTPDGYFEQEIQIIRGRGEFTDVTTGSFHLLHGSVTPADSGAPTDADVGVYGFVA